MREFQRGGLLHDIGRLVILIVSNSTSTPLAGVTWEHMISIVHDEKRVVGMNHCEVGQQICERWNFTPFLQEGVLRHHTPLIERDFSFPGTVLFLAHFVAGSDFTGEILERMVPPELFARIGLTPAGFAEAQELYRAVACP